jgi:PAS domain S-box-containing protein
MSREPTVSKKTKMGTSQRDENILHVLLDESTDPIFCFERDGTYRYINWAMARAFNSTPQAIIGKKIWDIFPREEADRRFALVKHVFESGETGTIEGRVPQPPPQKDLYFLTSCKPVFAPDGQVEMVICISKDITERKQAEDALRASEFRFREVTDQAPIAIAWANPEAKIEYINQAFRKLFGYELDEISTLEDWYLKAYPNPDERAVIVAKWVEGLKKVSENQSGPFTMQVPVTCKNGTVRITQATSTLINGAAYVVFNDVTDQIRAEEAIRQMNVELEKRVRERTAQLEQANRELESFSYSVSHDLRSPLRAIDGFTNILLEDYYHDLPPGGQQVSRSILNNTRRMSQLIDDLLAFSRLNRFEMRHVPVDMHALAELAFNELTTPENRQKIAFKLQPLPGMSGDPNLMRQVWLNLMSNAIKFSSRREETHIEVGFETRKEETVYYIRDNGAGFDMKYAGKLFGVFQRLHGIKDFEGTGVGLAIVQRIILRHGGRVWADAKIDHGATFYIALPCQNVQA